MPTERIRIRLFETPNKDEQNESYLDKDKKYRCGSSVIVMTCKSKSPGYSYARKDDYHVFHEESETLIWLNEDMLERP